MASFNGDIGTPSGAFNLKVEYTYTQSISGNYTDITATGYVKRNRSSVSPYNSSSSSTLTVDGESASYSGSYNLTTDGYKSIVSKSKRVYHNADGTKSINISFNFNGKLSSYYPNGSISKTIILPTIPRAANINSFTVSKRDETSFTFNWSASATVDYVWYSINNGSSWAGYDTADGTSGSFTVSGLAANTSYNCKLRIRRKDSQLTTDSGTVAQTTYDYPYCTNTPNFTIGNPLTLTFYNPLNRSISIKGYSSGNTEIFNGTTTGTSLTGFNDSGSVTAQYSTIPNATSGTYKVSVTYGSSTKTRNNGNTYSINANDCKPIFSNFEYSTDLSDLTGDNETIINGKTNTTVLISSTNKAIGNKSATIQRYSIQCGNMEAKLVNYSDNDVSLILNNCNSDILKVTAVDSRGLETTVTKTVTNFKNYFLPTFMSFNVDRENGVDTIAYLDLKLQFWNYNFGTINNTIRELNYKVKKQTDSEWSNWFSINVSSLSINNEEATLTNYLVYADGISDGFTVGTVYNLQLQVKDGASNYELSTVESDTFNLTDGQVAFSILKDNNGQYHIGINGMPDLDYNLKVHGTSG